MQKLLGLDHFSTQKCFQNVKFTFNLDDSLSLQICTFSTTIILFVICAYRGAEGNHLKQIVFIDYVVFFSFLLMLNCPQFCGFISYLVSQSRQMI